MLVIKKLRENRGITQAGLAEAAGLSQSYVCQLENGYGKNPSLETVTAIAEVLGVKLDELREAKTIEGQGGDHAGVGAQTS